MSLAMTHRSLITWCVGLALALGSAQAVAQSEAQPIEGQEGPTGDEEDEFAEDEEGEPVVDEIEPVVVEADPMDYESAPGADEETAPQVETAPPQGQTIADLYPPTTMESFLSRSHVRSALVEYRTAWHRGVGFLVNDRRTVVTMGNLRDRYRRITVKMLGSEGPEVRVASVQVMEQEDSSFVVLHLEGELSGQPLEISPDEPGVRESAYFIVRRGMRRRDQIVPDEIEAAEASITAASATTITVGAVWSQIWQGSPLFDGAGRVIAFFGSDGYAVRALEVFSEDRLESGRALLAPIVGVRVGTEFGGELVDPFLLEFDIGMALWDQLGVVLRVGVGIGDEVLAPYVRTSDLYATALAEERTVNLGLELKYRTLITRAAMPLYFDVVVGVNYTMSILEFHDVAIYQDAACDEVYEDCDNDVGFAGGRSTDHGVGPSFGFDIRAGLFTMGYRFIGESISYNLHTAHRLTFGVTFR